LSVSDKLVLIIVLLSKVSVLNGIVYFTLLYVVASHIHVSQHGCSNLSKSLGSPAKQEVTTLVSYSEHSTLY